MLAAAIYERPFCVLDVVGLDISIVCSTLLHVPRVNLIKSERDWRNGGSLTGSAAKNRERGWLYSTNLWLHMNW